MFVCTDLPLPYRQQPAGEFEEQCQLGVSKKEGVHEHFEEDKVTAEPRL